MARTAEVTSPYLLAVRNLLTRSSVALGFSTGELQVEIRAGQDSLFVVVRRPDRGGVAIRAVYLPVPFEHEALQPEPGELARLKIGSSLGEHLVILTASREAWSGCA